MDKRYNIDDGFGELFAAADTAYDNLKRSLVSAELSLLEHSDIEEQIAEKGLEILRSLFQVHVDLRAQDEVRRECVTGSDGIERNHLREGCKRNLETLFGGITVTRVGYSQRKASTLFPLDAALNLPEDMYSHGLRKRGAKESARGSFDAAVETIEETTGGSVPKRQLQNLVVDISQDFETFYSTKLIDDAEVTTNPLIISFDGKGVVMRQQALRDCTKKAAESEEHKLKTRLSKGEKRNRKRMAAVATVYDIEKHARSPKSVMGLEEKSATSPPRARNKRVWASLQRDQQQVTNEAFEEALRRNPNRDRPLAILVDGQLQQIKLIQSALKQHQLTGAVLVLDLVHVIEYLWKAAYCLNEEGSPEAEAWVEKRLLLILEGKSSSVAAGMRRSATLRQLTKNERKSIDTCADYLLKYSGMLKYDEYLNQGLPIATGVIEGACRHLIKDRMDLTGARWGLERAEAILKLRSINSSHDFEHYWKYYKAQSQMRLHSSQYQDPPWQSAA
jgi:hypothetical protein